MNKRIIALLLFTALISSSFVIAAAAEKPSFGKTFGKSFTDSLTSWIPFVNTPDFSGGVGDIYGWYNNTFLQIEEWEVTVCMSKLSTEVRKLRDSSLSLTSLSNDDSVYTTTVTLSGTKTRYNASSWLYEVSWYVMPYNDDVPYRVFLVSGSDDRFYPPNDNEDWEESEKYVGSSGYEPFYSSTEYTKFILEYKESDEIKPIPVTIAEK
jgi:hypothetical protein